uniref:Cytochrome c oxidase subunit 2 n=1 Tax=Idris sp. MM-2013 TaxID=1429433 RepID=A0A067YF98_9HYME|nr:cytochrome c oxidase subunit II [Idris sp. MM-2013]
MMTWKNILFQDAMSPIMFHLIFFHELIMIIIISIISIILYFIIIMSKNKFYCNKIIDHQILETIWTILPLMILFILAVPSISLLYMTDEIKSPNLTIKSIGRQWYWSYEYPQFKDLKFNSYMIKPELMELNDFRLLDVDHRLILPSNMKIRLLTTSNDVIHSFTVPSMGFKMDSIPGRINQSSFISLIPGIFFGQCSEICGMNHSFMPIVIELISKPLFNKWLMNIN